MISNLRVEGFKGVPYLESSALMSRHHGKLKFSVERPNVIVGPNGSGKSALLQTLAIRFLAWFTGQSSFDGKYVLDRHSPAWWTDERGWGHEYTFLKGLNCKTDNGPALYYRPAHVPGNEADITHSMMLGYFDEARAYGALVEDKSSGQQCQALLERLLAPLSGENLPSAYAYVNWRFKKDAVDLRKQGWNGTYDYQAEVLKKLFVPASDALPLVLMDEPEQSLDAMSEARLWSAIAKADCSKVQVIVATHSLYPLMHPDRFNLIEAQDGYAQRVCAELLA